MQKLVADLVNVEEAFSTRINQILHSDLAKNLKDDSKLLLSGLLFADRNRLIRAKLDKSLKELDARNTLRDPRIGGLKTVISGKGGFLDAFNEAYGKAQQEQVQKLGQAFNDVGCPACLIARNLESELPGLAGLARKQLPRGNAVSTLDGSTFIADGKTFVVRANPEGFLRVLTPEGKEESMNTAANPVHKRLNEARLNFLNSGKTVSKVTVPTAATAAPAKPEGKATPIRTASWAKEIPVENDLVQNEYPQAVQDLLQAPDPVEGARKFFRNGPFYLSKRDKVDKFLADPRFKDQAPGLIREFLSNRSSRYRHCPSCWLGERFQWNPHY